MVEDRNGIISITRYCLGWENGNLDFELKIFSIAMQKLVAHARPNILG